MVTCTRVWLIRVFMVLQPQIRIIKIDTPGDLEGRPSLYLCRVMARRIDIKPKPSKLLQATRRWGNYSMSMSINQLAPEEAEEWVIQWIYITRDTDMHPRMHACPT